MAQACRKHLQWILLFTVAYLTVTHGASCFYPDAQPAVDFNFMPCGAGNTISTCCVPSEGDVCLSNGLCNWTGHNLYRGACTDPSWKSEKCGNYCLLIHPTGYQALQDCGGTNYCCTNGTNCCNDPGSVFQVPVGSVSNDYQSTSIASLSGTGSGSLSTSSSVPSQSTTGNPTPHPSTKTSIGIGVSVGVLAIVILAGGIVTATYCIRKRRYLHAESPPMELGYNPNTGEPFSGQRQHVSELHSTHTLSTQPASQISSEGKNVASPAVRERPALGVREMDGNGKPLYEVPA